MSDIPDHIQIKLQNAENLIPGIMKLCLREATYPRGRQRSKIGVLLGDMAQALRSALNYAMWDFAESNIKLRVSEDEYEKVRYSHDFPIEEDKESFEESRSRIVRHIASDFAGIYQFLERAQPYHDQGKHLWYLKVISNYAAHTIPIKAQPVRANDVAFVRVKPRILGNQVIVPSPGGSSHRIYPSIPCFVEELKMFVSKKKKWVVYLIELGEGAKPNLIPFVHTANRKVTQLVSEFYTLW